MISSYPSAVSGNALWLPAHFETNETKSNANFNTTWSPNSSHYQHYYGNAEFLGNSIQMVRGLLSIY